MLALTGCSGEPVTRDVVPVDGPVTAILRAAWGDFGVAKRAGQEAAAENLVAECMAAEGFEYVPRDDSPTGDPSSEEDLVDQNTEEWIAQYGYGIVMDMEPTVQHADEEPAGQLDPNADYLAALSESEVTAYFQTLYGTQPELADEETGISVDSWEDQGCRGWAQHEVAGGEQDPTTDPRVLEATAAWADCMADAGFTGLTTPDSGHNSVQAQNVFVDEHGNPASPSQDAISAFRELEISTALTDFRCTEKVDWQGVRDEVNRKGEELWIKDNEVALDEFTAALQEYLT